MRGQQNTPVTAQTVLDLYGDSVEPWDSTRTAAMQHATAQSVGHGVTAGQVSVNVVTTYSQQQVRGRNDAWAPASAHEPLHAAPHRRNLHVVHAWAQTPHPSPMLTRSLSS